MGIECSYSFRDLFVAAHGRSPREDEYADLMQVTQDERNKRIRAWAEKAGWEIDERVGADGRLYCAFCPSFRGSFRNNS